MRRIGHEKTVQQQKDIIDPAMEALTLGVMQEVRDLGKTPPNGKPPAPVNDFRGSKFEIQQDFRDQDPDRVAAIFQKDIERAVVNRSMSTRAFGLGF
jgi:hypothetical protein